MKKLAKSLFVIVILFSAFGQRSFSQSDEILFRRHILLSGYNGLYYGLAFDYIFGVKDAAAAGLPVITAGTCALVPLLTNSSKTITSNQLLLTSHGQTLGWAHGFGLSCLIFGNNLFDSEAQSKITTGLAAGSSIGMGLIGRHLALTKDWSEGRVALYRHYGWVGPFTGFSIAASFSDDARVFGAAIILGGISGYYIADKVNDHHEFSRGSVRAIQVLSAFNTALGYCIFADTETDDGDLSINRIGWLYPAIGAVSGTMVGQLVLKNMDLTPAQGMTSIYAAGGGALIGLGIALITNSDDFTPYYLIPYVTGVGAYGTALALIKKNTVSGSSVDLQNGKRWNFSFMPQNLYLNNKIADMGYKYKGRQIGLQPLFSASLTF